MSVLDMFSKLVGIASGILAIAKECRNYVNGRKSSKKDPSTSLPASDGSSDD